MGVGDAQNQTGQDPPRESGQQTTQRENTPEEPGAEAQGAQGEPQPSEQNPQPSDGQPDDPRAADDPERTNIAGADPRSSATDEASAIGAADRWGDLPVHVRDLFRYEGGHGMPPEYRDWIDSYYRRLNDGEYRR
ncbi:MAG: hypothetical protein QF903_06215 [Planctomycetota bacterium]|jgi:hypothetical protein|nr:hypothetical protein [Planctomycetota bacterium]MDP6763831.1 hypothetical protein [Planctomycetota bacterium]MDP6989055.1 hypothetical protein [Planctomycetota bacterium]